MLRMTCSIPAFGGARAIPIVYSDESGVPLRVILLDEDIVGKRSRQRPEPARQRFLQNRYRADPAFCTRASFRAGRAHGRRRCARRPPWYITYRTRPGAKGAALVGNDGRPRHDLHRRAAHRLLIAQICAAAANSACFPPPARSMTVRCRDLRVWEALP